MNDDPYGDEIKALAAQSEPSVARADARVVLDNPLCGDRVSLELTMEAGRVVAIGHAVKGCLLCRAAAAVVADLALGLDEGGAARLLEGAAGDLKGKDQFTAVLPKAFLPVRPHKSRHGCVLLPFRALVKAFKRS